MCGGTVVFPESLITSYAFEEAEELLNNKLLFQMKYRFLIYEDTP